MNEKKILCVFRNDDFSALSDIKFEEEIFGFFEQAAIPQTIGVVPFMTENPHNSKEEKWHSLSENPAAVSFLKKGVETGLIEVALHGFNHQTNLFHPTSKRNKSAPLYPGPGNIMWSPFNPANREWYSEWSGFSLEKQVALLKKGKEYLESLLKIEIASFIPPWNSYDDNTMLALGKTGFKVISAKLSVHNHLRFIRQNGPPFLVEFTTHLANFSTALETARAFVGKNGRYALLVLLYHSWNLQHSLRRKKLLEEIFRTNAEANDMRFVTLKELSRILPDDFRKIACLKAQAGCHLIQANSLRRLLRLKPLSGGGFEYLYADDQSRYLTQIKKARKAKLLFYVSDAFIFFLLGLWLSRSIFR